MNRKRFERIVEEALDGLPEFFQEKLGNVQILVEDRPSPELLEELGMDPEQDALYGLYQGTPLTERAFDDVVRYPDAIVIYQKELEQDFGDDPKLLRQEIQTTVVHEIAHHFGIDDEKLEEMGWE